MNYGILAQKRLDALKFALKQTIEPIIIKITEEYFAKISPNYMREYINIPQFEDARKCKKICHKTIDEEGIEYCLGCGRTMEEIINVYNNHLKMMGKENKDAGN